MQRTFIFDPKLFAALAEWVNTDENISPATIQIHELSINPETGELKDHVWAHTAGPNIPAIYVSQGDEGAFIDNNGDVWTHDENREGYAVKEEAHAE